MDLLRATRSVRNVFFSLCLLSGWSFLSTAAAEDCSCGDGLVPVLGCCGGEGERPCVVDSVFSDCDAACEGEKVISAILSCVEPAETGDDCGPHRPCVEGNTCFPIVQQCYPASGDLANDPAACLEAYSPILHDKVYLEGLGTSPTFGFGGAASAVGSASGEVGVLYGADGRYGCYSQTCTGLAADISAGIYVSRMAWKSYDDVAGKTNLVTAEAGGIFGVAALGAYKYQLDFCDPTADHDGAEWLGGGSAFTASLGIPVSLGCYTCETSVITSSINVLPPPRARCKINRDLPDGKLDFEVTLFDSPLPEVIPDITVRPGIVCADTNSCTAQVDINNESYDPRGEDITVSQTFLRFPDLTTGSVVATQPFPIGSTGSDYYTDVIKADLTVTNESGRSDSCGGAFMVADCTPPEITGCPAPVTLECQEPRGAWHVPPKTAEASDNCSDADLDDYSGSGRWFPLGTMPLEINARNDWGKMFAWLYSSNLAGLSSCVNVCDFPEVYGVDCTDFQRARALANAQGNSVVTVVDTIPPDMSSACPADLTVECQSNGKAAASFSVSAAADACDGTSSTPVCNVASGASFSLGSTAVSCAASDAQGNTGTCGFKVNVVDSQTPGISCPSPVTRECSTTGGVPQSSFGAFLGGVSASDACDPMVTKGNNAPTFFALGDTSVLFTATDDSGNSNSCSATARVVDTKSPDMTCPAMATHECSAPGGAPAADFEAFLAGASASDICYSSLSQSNDAPAFFALGNTSVTFSAEDGSGNTGSCSATARVVDTTPPAISCPSDITVEPVSPVGTVVAYAATSWNDTCDDSLPTPTCPLSGSTFPVGSTTEVECSVTDATGGLTSSCSLMVQVLSEEEIIANLQAEVAALADDFTNGQENALNKHLTDLLKALAKDKTNATCGKLDDLIDQIQNWEVEGILSSEEADVFTDSAGNLQMTIGCSA